MKCLVTDAILTSFSSRADKSLGFRGVTPELSSAEKALFMDMQGINVRLLIEPKDYASDGKREIKNPLSHKSPSERLRAVLFVLHKQLTEKKKLENQSFDEFYTRQLESVIESYKQQLEPEI